MVKLEYLKDGKKLIRTLSKQHAESLLKLEASKKKIIHSLPEDSKFEFVNNELNTKRNKAKDKKSEE